MSLTKSTISNTQRPDPPIPPRIARLVLDLGMVTILCFLIHYQSVTLLSICAGCYYFFSVATSPDGNKILKRRDYFWIFAGVAVFVVLAVLIGHREFPTFDAFIKHPVFLISLWLLLSTFTIWLWFLRRSKLKHHTTSHQLPK